MRMSSNSRTLPSLIFPSLAVEVAAVPFGAGTPPIRSSATPSEKPLPRTTRPGMIPGAVDVGSTLRPAFGSNGLMIPRDAELREDDRRAVDTDELLARGAGRVVLDLDALGVDRDDVGHVRLEPGDAQAELARDVDAEVAAEQAEHVDGDVEGAEDAGQVDRHAARLPPAAALPSASVARSSADRDREDDHAVLEAEVGEADGRALQAQRAEVDDARRRPRRRGLRR